MSSLDNWFNKVSSKIGEAIQETNSSSLVNEESSYSVAITTEGQICSPSTNLPIEKKVAIDSKEELLRNVISTLKKTIEFKDYTFNKELIIWLNCDQVLFDNYCSNSYKQQVISALYNECGYKFVDVSFCIGKPDDELRATIVGTNALEYLQILDIEDTKKIKSCKAIITIFGGAGSLIKEQYMLSSEDLKEKHIAAYNIGSGQYPKVPIGYRENHIAIDDNPSSPQIEKNKFVSRMHAHIGLSDNFGFYLQVERDGTRLMGKRTRIFRGEDIIECDNPIVKIPLKSGDLIELGKAVVLKYTQIDE